jgi:hypothetical protein
MKNIFIVSFLLASSLLKIAAQGFSGSIEFKFYTRKDTTSNIYFVKDKLIKLDNFTKKSNGIEGSFIFDLAAQKIKFVSPSRKVWGEHKSNLPPLVKGVCEVVVGQNTKTVSGMKCKEYTVKNTAENTTITYWITEGKFYFFAPVLKLWNRKDKQSVYFTYIKNLPEGSMPMLSEEKLISDGKLITKLEVTKINKKTPEPSQLEVPPGFTMFE